jgi:hypothetical protein
MSAREEKHGVEALRKRGGEGDWCAMNSVTRGFVDDGQEIGTEIIGVACVTPRGRPAMVCFRILPSRNSDGGSAVFLANVVNGIEQSR